MDSDVAELCCCSHEAGDSDCPAHPTCAECGADISGHSAVGRVPLIADEVEALRSIREEIRWQCEPRKRVEIMRQRFIKGLAILDRIIRSHGVEP